MVDYLRGCTTSSKLLAQLSLLRCLVFVATELLLLSLVVACIDVLQLCLGCQLLTLLSQRWSKSTSLAYLEYAISRWYGTTFLLVDSQWLLRNLVVLGLLTMWSTIGLVALVLIHKILLCYLKLLSWFFNDDFGFGFDLELIRSSALLLHIITSQVLMYLSRRVS